MKVNMAKELAALDRLTVTQLRQKHIEVFGEQTRSGNKDWLRKRIAWRMQANCIKLQRDASGGVSGLIDDYGRALRVTHTPRLVAFDRACQGIADFTARHLKLLMQNRQLGSVSGSNVTDTPGSHEFKYDYAVASGGPGGPRYRLQRVYDPLGQAFATASSQSAPFTPVKAPPFMAVDSWDLQGRLTKQSVSTYVSVADVERELSDRLQAVGRPGREQLTFVHELLPRGGNVQGASIGRVDYQVQGPSTAAAPQSFVIECSSTQRDAYVRQHSVTIRTVGTLVCGATGKCVTRFEHNTQGELISLTTPLGRTTKLTYEEQGSEVGNLRERKLIARSGETELQFACEYDRRMNLPGKISSPAYTAEARPYTAVTRTIYDAEGNTTRLEEPSVQGTWRERWLPRLALAGLVPPRPRASNYTTSAYRDDGLLSSTTDQRGMETEYQYYHYSATSPPETIEAASVSRLGCGPGDSG